VDAVSDPGAVRERLEERLAQLLTRTGKIESDLRRPGERDWEEQAIQRQNDEVLEHLGVSERSEVDQLRAALARLDGGRYGQCERCGREISSERLAALPATPICVDCAQSITA
jgi:RNA polymerase-binding transcription factor DksA